MLREAELGSGSLQLIDCHGCYVYALAPLRCVELLGCCGCTVVLGAVSRVLSVSYCEQLRLVATCKALRLANCIDGALQLCVNTPPQELEAIALLSQRGTNEPGFGSCVLWPGPLVQPCSQNLTWDLSLGPSLLGRFDFRSGSFAWGLRLRI